MLYIVLNLPVRGEPCNYTIPVWCIHDGPTVAQPTADGVARQQEHTEHRDA